jgi:type IV pilus assembly protein PilO
MDFLKKPLVIIIMASLVVGLLFFYVYSNVISPIEAENERLAKKLQLEKQMLATISQQVSDTTKENMLHLKTSHDKVPAKANIGQFLLSLERAEVVSDSLILSMDIVERVVEEDMEEGPEQITVTLSVVSPNYFSMQSFLTSIEENKRITTVDSLIFTGEDEAPLLTNTGEIAYDVTLSTYYLPKYKQLIDEIPMHDFYKVGMKTNPLYGTVFNVEDKKIHGIINTHISAINEQDTIKLTNTLHNTTENNTVSTNAINMLNENVQVELIEVTIEAINKADATVHYVQKVRGAAGNDNYEDRIVEGTYFLTKENDAWKISDIFVSKEVLLQTE